MVRKQSRLYARKESDAFVQYAKTAYFLDARLKNYSVDGMSFVGENFVSPGEEVSIRLLDKIPDTLTSRAFDDCRAVVKWCRRKTGTGAYEIGVQRKRNLPVFNLKGSNWYIDSFPRFLGNI